MGKGKKRRQDGDTEVVEPKRTLDMTVLRDPYHPSRPYKITVAIAGTVIDNAVGPQRKAYLAGQIARAVAIFNVDEILIFNDKGHLGESKGCSLLAQLLAHLECPPYLKKSLFQLEEDLQYIGLIPPLCLPHHFGRNEISKYRDGVTTKPPGLVDVGLSKKVHCDVELPEGIRVTVKLNNPEIGAKGGRMKGELVSPSEPREKTQLYWGYKITSVDSIINILEDPTYDCIIGTSDKGTPISELEISPTQSFDNILIVFGGVDGLESTVGFENDSESAFRNRFTYYLNVRPSQGTKTIRTEEAIPLTLGALEPVLRHALGRRK